LAAFPLITDPYFYAVTVPAVLLLDISKSGFGAGFGSLTVPMMALAVSVQQAAAILMPLLFVMDVVFSRPFQPNRSRVRWVSGGPQRNGHRKPPPPSIHPSNP